jgi:hypothetical protein
MGRGDERHTQLAGHTGAGPTPSDSSIDLGSLPSSTPATGEPGIEPVSDVSAVAWAALVEEPPADQVKVDSPSDADLLAATASEVTASTPPAGPEEEKVGELISEEPAAQAPASGVDSEVVHLTSTPPKPKAMTSDSMIDLGALPAELAAGESGAAASDVAPSESGVFMAELASNVRHVELVSDSDMNIAEEAVASAGEGESSAVDLGATPVEDEENLSAEGEGQAPRVLSGSGIDIDLEGLPVPGMSPSDSHPSSVSSVDLGSHADIMPPSSSEEGIAESALEVEAASDEAMEALETPSGEAAAEEPPVSEEEVNDLLAGLEERPGAGEAAEEAAEIAEGEEAIAAAEAEEEAAAEAEEEKKPTKAAKDRSRVLYLAGATGLGILIGAVGDMGARALFSSGEKEKASGQQAQVQRAASNNPPATFDSFKTMVSNGDWEGASKAGIETAPANTPEEFALRGQFRLGQFLEKNGTKFSNAQDPNLQPVIQDLKEAAQGQNPDPSAVYDLALIKELAGDLQGARTEYANGAKTFANDPAQKQIFDTAVSRVEWKESSKAPKRPGASTLPRPRNVEDRAAVLALLLVALQQPPVQPGQQPAQPGQQPAQAENKEAGFEFWRAAKLAQEGKFSEAVQSLDKARALHQDRRFSRLRKAQNPLSDPTEDIFLRCCEELRVYWELENRLRAGGYLIDRNTPEEALQALVQKADASAGGVKALTDQLVAAKVIGKDEGVMKGITRLVDEKKAADAKLADLKAMVQAAKDESAKLDGNLKTAEKTIKERDADLSKTKEQIAKLKTDYDSLNGTVTKIRDELAAGQFLDPQSKASVSEAVKRAVDVAKSKDSSGTMRRQREEISQLSESLKQSRRPEEMLPLWLLLLDENRNSHELASKAEQDAERVKSDARATAAQKGEAEVILGLALRNADQFSKAKSVLEAARGSVDKGEWLVRADAALKEVSNPAAYLTSQAQLWYDHGQMEAALDALKRAEKVLAAKEHGKLWAQRSLIELDAARSKTKGPLPPTEPLLVAAQKDAEAAVKAGMAEGHYAEGRIAEELGQMDSAIKSYRAAVAAHGNQLDAEGGRYRMALARVLLLAREERPNPPGAPARAGQKLGWHDPAYHPAEYFKDMKNLVVLFALGLQAPLPGQDPSQEEAERLADEVLRSPSGTVPFNVLAQALAIKGRWNAALQTYVEGLRPMLPREYGNGLMFLIRSDPRLKQSDSMRAINPLDAEKHYALGLNSYFDRDYANAEKEFLLTIENDSQDARFFYFLGLSRLAQNRRRDAFADFTQGTALERMNRPSPAVVDDALERVQGPIRLILNGFRERQ